MLLLLLVIFLRLSGVSTGVREIKVESWRPWGLALSLSAARACLANPVAWSGCAPAAVKLAMPGARLDEDCWTPRRRAKKRDWRTCYDAHSVLKVVPHRLQVGVARKAGDVVEVGKHVGPLIRGGEVGNAGCNGGRRGRSARERAKVVSEEGEFGERAALRVEVVEELYAELLLHLAQSRGRGSSGAAARAAQSCFRVLAIVA